jgi:TRAP-type uncharacterized transport system substrate-binding protein
MASLFASSAELRVVPMLGDTGAGNLSLLLDHPSVDLAFVSTDVLGEQAAKENSLTDKLELVARLSPQEVHLLARSDIGAASELSRKPVGFGPAGSASAIAGAALFRTLGIEIEAVHLDATAAIEQLKHGTISAAVIVGGRPSPLVAAIPITAGIHLLPVPFSAPLDAAYLPARLESADYPNLIRTGRDVTTIATGIVLLAARTKADPGAQRRLDRFVAALFPRFAELEAQGRHPKWRESCRKPSRLEALPRGRSLARRDSRGESQALEGKHSGGPSPRPAGGHEQAAAGGPVQAVHRVAARQGALTRGFC